MTSEDIMQAKNAVAPLIMQIEGVTGVGVGQTALNVYLKTDHPGVRAQAEEVLRAHAPGTPVHFFIIGEVEASSGR